MALDELQTRRTMAFYRFCKVLDPVDAQQQLQSIGAQLDLRGTILVAHEGVNGTLVGSIEQLQLMQTKLREIFGDVPVKWSEIDPENQGFFRFKVKLKEEIVTFGVPNLDVEKTGMHVGVEEWNALLADPEVVVVDTRNQYEIDIGTFPGAVSPETTNFREFPVWVSDNLDPAKQKKVAMFCTGGIRCEKASAYMLEQGFESVFQLDGGILKYLEEADQAENEWSGECFVFDQRVSVNAALEQGSYEQCFACRHPLSAQEKESEHYEEGVCCPHCVAEVEKGDRRRFRDRQKQIELAKARGEKHLGVKQS